MVRYGQRVWSIKIPVVAASLVHYVQQNSFNPHLAFSQLQLDDFLFTYCHIRNFSNINF